MDPLTWGFIGTLIGTVVGASASILTTIINTRNVSRNQNKIEIYKRQEIFREFQRDNYLKIQEDIYKALAIINLMHIQGLKNFEDTGKWHDESPNSENYNELMAVLRDLMMYLERIENEKLRGEVRVILGKMTTVSSTSGWRESIDLLAQITFAVNDVMKILGTELRNNYYSGAVI